MWAGYVELITKSNMFIIIDIILIYFDTLVIFLRNLVSYTQISILRLA